jgi:sodium/potassium-transporting ATPase subunit alpha
MPTRCSRRSSTGFPFDVEKRRAAAVVTHEDQHTFVVKGAWESLPPLCPSVTQEAVDATVNRLSSQGLRIIALASRVVPAEMADADREVLEAQLELTALFGIADAVRRAVPEAVRKCGLAGISVIMIKGGSPANRARDRARSMYRSEVRHRKGAQRRHPELTDESTLVQALENGVRIFARTTPEQKLKIVSALQAMHKVVAMTGDGVNDAPALKASDIGVAMGREGTDVARESAQIVLLDDNFTSIVAGIEKGRAVFSNIPLKRIVRLEHRLEVANQQNVGPSPERVAIRWPARSNAAPSIHFTSETERLHAPCDYFRDRGHAGRVRRAAVDGDQVPPGTQALRRYGRL